MADIKKLSEQIVDVGERLGNIAEAAQGKDGHKAMPRARWLLLPAAGAGVYALATSRAFARQARDAVKDARARASDLPEDLLGRVNKATRSGANGRQASRRRSTTNRSRRKTASKAS